MLKPTTTASNLRFKGRVIDVSSETLRYANGREYEIDFVRHPGAAAVVAVDDARRICLVRQYRHGIGDFLWEIPAGKLDRGEAPETCAVRELAEETGVSARRSDSTFRRRVSSPRSSTCTWHASSRSAPRSRTPTRSSSSSGCRSHGPWSASRSAS